MSTPDIANSSANASPEDAAVDTTPFLSSAGDDAGVGGNRSAVGGRRQRGLREAARFLRRASGNSLMREPSMLVRETAAEQLEERQSDWAYSKPVVVLDVVWNLAFVSVAAAVLGLSQEERPKVPLRFWIVGYALQCVLHMVCVCVEYRRRRRNRQGRGQPSRASSSSSPSSSFMEDGNNPEEQDVLLGNLEQENTSSIAKHLESANTMFSFIWWIIGFYWVSAGGQALAQGSPQLYWLCIIFLGFDVFFVVFCIALACVIGIAVCCCLPCIIAILYAVADQEGASKEDIDQISKYKFRKFGYGEKLDDGVQSTAGGIMSECGTDSPDEHALSQEDAECCICLAAYEDGVELRQLPCGHHFHCACVDKWLHINATCPLCKYNILKSSSTHGSEEV